MALTRGHGGQLLLAGGNDLVQVLAGQLTQQLGDSGILGLNADCEEG